MSFGRRYWGSMVVVMALAASAGCLDAAEVSAAGRDADIQFIVAHLQPAVRISGEPLRVETLPALMKQAGVTGVSVAYSHGRKIVWAQGFGTLREGGPAVDSQTLFQAASISKPVAAVAVLRLAEDGRVNLDRDVNQDLKSWKVPENEWTRQEKVTPRRLLTHTAGTTVHGFAGYASGAQVPTLSQVLAGAPPANSEPVRVDVLPGTIWRYSGGGFEILQQLVSDLTGRTFPELMEETVLKPAGMTQSTYLQPLPVTRLANAAAPHDEKGVPVKGGAYTYPEQAAAGLWTTPSDLVRLALDLQGSLAGEAGHVLTPETARAMVAQGGQGGWGLGVQVGGDAAHPWFSHDGANTGFRARWVSFDSGDAAAVMTNGDRGAAVADAIMRTLAVKYGWSDFRPVARKVLALSDSELDWFVGRYRLDLGPELRISRRGHRLFAQDPSGAEEEVLPQSRESLFWRAQAGELKFDPGSKDHASAFSLEEQGQVFHAARLP